MILVPVKSLANAKQRLASLLDQPTRTKLAQAMLFDVLETLGTWASRPEVGVVTSDPFAIELARRFDFQIIPDNANRGETDAIEMATRYCESRGVDSTLVIPGDVPLIQVQEFEQILGAAPAEGSVLTPAADGRGTNAAWRRPGDCSPCALETIASNPIWQLRAQPTNRVWFYRSPALLSTSTTLPTCGNSRRPRVKPALNVWPGSGT